MPGGGKFRLDPGQITDDSQMMLKLAEGLVKNGQFNLQTIAIKYYEWYKSSPFDIGLTIRNPLKRIEKQINENYNGNINNFLQQNKYSEIMIFESELKNGNSLSNGGLMRLSPLAIFLSFYKIEEAL